MKKVLVLMIALLVAFAPMSFAYDFCAAADSDPYADAAVGKLGCGITNAAFGWLELIHQPQVNENAWEGVGRGVVHTIGRTASGVLEAATFIIPDAKIPLLDPNCPLDMLGSASGSSTK